MSSYENGNKNQTMVNVTGLWLSTDRKGDKYMAGNCGSLRYWIFKNQNKKKDSDPDYLLKLSQNNKIKKSNDNNEPLDYDSVEYEDDVPF